MKNKPINFTSSIVLLLLYWFQFLSFNIRHPSSIIVDNCFRSNFDASARELLSKQIGNFWCEMEWGGKLVRWKRILSRRRTAKTLHQRWIAENERESEGKFNLCCRISCVYQLLFLTFQFHSCSRRNSNSSSASSQCEKFTTYKVFRYCQRVSQMRRIFESSLTEAKWKIDSNHQSKAAAREILTCCKKSPARTEEERFKIIVNFSIWQILLFHFLYENRKKETMMMMTTMAAGVEFPRFNEPS